MSAWILGPNAELNGLRGFSRRSDRTMRWEGEARRAYYAKVRSESGQDAAAVLIAAVNREWINRPAV